MNSVPTQEEINTFVAAGQIADMPTLQRLLSLYGSAIINSRDSHIQACALTWAAALGYKEIVTYLLDQGANIEMPGTEDRTALGYAATGGHADLVAYLLERGASLDARDRAGRDIMAQIENTFYGSAVREVIAAWKKKLENERLRQEEARQKQLSDKTDAQIENLKKHRPAKPALKKPRP